MKARMIEVNVEFVIAALESRYDDVKALWGNDASEELWEQALSLAEDCGLSNCSSPSAYVDNYLINGEFVSKEKDFNHWSKHYLDLYDFSDSLEVIEAWENYCENNALIYNDEHACLQF